MIHFCLLIANACTFAPIMEKEDAQEVVGFLADDRSSVGFSYLATAGELNGLILPLSYYSTADYWAKYVGTLPGNDLTVVDVYNEKDYTLTPSQDKTLSPGSDLQIERVNVYNGTDIYDASCWQIALALAGFHGLSPGQKLLDLTQNQDLLLQLGYGGDQKNPQKNANRAITSMDHFSYNRTSITNPANAYFFRMVTTNWLSTDPFLGTSYAHYVTAQDLPDNPDYQAGLITWMDWKPITGENAWGFLIGPLQAARLRQQAGKKSYVPFSSKAVQNAIGVLHPLSAMQSPLGGIYYACKGSLGNTGSEPVNPHEISVENNASSLAGLILFEQVLQDELKNESDLTAEQKTTIQDTLKTIQTMIFGGSATEGLLAFFKKYAWDDENGIFYQGGLGCDPMQPKTWMPTIEPKAVDVNTWGISVLGQPTLDLWFGFGTAYQIWQKVKSWGGFYGPDQNLWGVGYSDQDEKGIMSAEWTAGAINMARCLITQYEEASKSSAYSKMQQSEAMNYVKSLQEDHTSMCARLLSLRTDLYPTVDAFQEVRPENYASLIPIPSGKKAFLYASKRYLIPFGWFANPLPSTTSSAWALMLNFNYNPFHPEGIYQAIEWDLLQSPRSLY